MTFSLAAKLSVLLLFIGSTLYVHLRGKARLPMLRQFVNHSALFAPYNALMYLFSAVPSKPYLDRSKFPEAGASPALDFPAVEQGTLKNGIKVFFAKRDAVPTVRVAVSFNAGYAADPTDKRGITSMMSTLMKSPSRAFASSK